MDDTQRSLLEAVQKLTVLVTNLTDDKKKKWYSSREAEAYLGVTPDVMKTARMNGKLTYYKHGKTIWYDRAELDNYILSGRVI